MNSPLINILIRTSAREKAFSRCLQSIQQQTYRNVRLVVSYDTEKRPEYVPLELGERLITAIPVPKCTTEYGYNLYCNDLISQVNEGYWLILDDDGLLYNKTVIEHLVPHLKENKANIVRFIRGKKVKPPTKAIISGKIGMPCILLHAKHKGIAQFDDSSNADYKFIKEAVDKLGMNYIPMVVVRDDVRQRGAMEE